MRPFSWLLIFLLAVSVINYPNPLNPKGGEVEKFDCTLAATTEAFLYIYDLAARIIYQTPFNLQGGSTNRVTWNGYNGYHEPVGNGIYLYQIIDQARHRIGKGKIWVINK